jgi:PAS domain S-box-containing protein
MPPEHLLAASFEPLRVATSIVIAIVASHAALALSARVGSRSGSARLPWLLGGGLSVGLGIAAMHFVGMLAMHLPVPVTYDATLTIISFVVAVIASTAALAAATTSTLRIGPMLVASTLFGTGVAGMHYVGMAALRGPFSVTHDPARVALSLAIAVGAAAVAFRLAYQLRNVAGRRGFALQLGSATVMGVAIAGMHYTAMSAVHFSAQNHTAANALSGIAHDQVGTLVTAVGLIVLTAAILVAFLDQRARHAAREASLTNERYREMAEAMPQIVWTARGDGVVEYFNRRWSEYTGIPENRALEVGWQCVIHPDDYDLTIERWTDALSRGVPFDMEIRIKRAIDGEYRWHLARSVPLVDADGRIIKWLGTSTDTHEQKRAAAILLDRQVTLEHRIEDREAEAERATALYQLLAENATDMVSTHGPNGAFDYATPSWREYVGVELASKRPVDFCHPEDVARLAANHLLGLRSSQLVTTVWRCRRADGSYGWLETRARAVRDAVTKRVVTFVCATHDVSDRQRREQEFQLLHGIVLAVTSAPNLDAALDVTLRQVCAATDWSYGEVWMPSRDARRLERSSVWHARDGIDVAALTSGSVGLTLAPNEGIAGLAWKEGEVIWIRDMVADARTKNALVSAAGFTAGVAVPVTMQGIVVAVLVFMMPTAVADDARRVALVSVVGAQLGALVARMRDELALRESEEKYRQLVEQAADAILLVDADRQCVEANTRAGLLLGRSPLELIGRRLDSFLSSDVAGMAAMGAVNTGEVLTAEYWVRRADGTSIPVEASAALLPDRRVQIIARDISGRRELERLKDEFLSVVSHELRTPLTSIRGSLGLLASGSLASAPEKGQRMLDVAVVNTDRLIRLINDILDVERINSGTIPMEPDWCDGSDLSRSVAEAMRPMADRAGVSLHVRGCPTRLWADSDRITQALTNLVGNAIKFSPSGSIVELNLSMAHGNALFEVRDHGRGIPADKLEIIFERFQQVDTSDAREKGGTGLGLAITRGIVRQHGGRIWAENTTDGAGGTSFKFSLPLRDDGDGTTAYAANTQANAHVTRILVIEDDLALANVIATALEAHGFEVEVAHNGAEAIELHQVSKADVLIVDLSLPDINGLDLLERIRVGHRSSFPNAPAIIYTASDPNGAARDRIRGMGAELATKSRVSTEALVERVIRLLNAPSVEPMRAAS